MYVIFCSCTWRRRCFSSCSRCRHSHRCRRCHRCCRRFCCRHRWYFRCISYSGTCWHFTQI